jgi:AcrR family transcriptional regulator
VRGSRVHGIGAEAGCAVCEELSRALAELVAEDGFEAASEEALCARARVSQEQFAAHVGSVHGCLVEAFQGGADLLYDRAAKAFGRDGRWETAFQRAIAAVASEIAARPGLGQLLYVEALERGGPEVWRRRDRVRQRFIDLLSREDDREGLPPLRFELLAGALDIALRQRVIEDRGWDDVPRLAAELAELGRVFEPVAA